MAERVTLTTDDNVLIIGDWSPAPTVVGAAILLHMKPETRASWLPVQRALAKRNIASLAIDLRGHGESTQTVDGNTLAFADFDDEAHQASILDVSAAIAWVRKRGLDIRRIALGGASFGANLAVVALVDEPNLAGGVLLSPGADYSGLKAVEDAEFLSPDQALQIVASDDDAKSFEDSKKLFGAAPSEHKTFFPLKNAGHGTAMLKSEATLTDKIADWMAEMIGG